MWLTLYAGADVTDELQENGGVLSLEIEPRWRSLTGRGRREIGLSEQ